jgi:ribonucleoside-diphosphate reductase alpha chain
MSRYARFRDDLGRRENWEETVDRYVSFFEKREGSKLPRSLWAELRSAIGGMKVMPSMRAMMSAGPALEKENLCGFNCSYLSISRVRSLAEMLYILMCGTGVGFSVERQLIKKLPEVAEGLPAIDKTPYVVEDSKEGWAEAYEHLLTNLWEENIIPTFDYSLVRPAGERLMTMGGRASGPGPLKDLFQFTIQTFMNARGRRLHSTELHDLACKVGEIVVVGGVRRSALISLSNLSDDRMRDAKSGNWYITHPWRSMANNSAAYTEKPDCFVFTKEWLALMNSGSGERGIFNREVAQRRVKNLPTGRDHNHEFGTNPCGEIILRDMGLCNLTEVILRPTDTYEQMVEKVRYATILGTLQSTLTKFKFVDSTWEKNAIEERLLGVSLTGILDLEVFRLQNGFSEKDARQILRDLRKVAHEVNKEFADLLGIEPSKAITCVKPSGTVSLLTNCSPGIHPGYGNQIIRRIRNDMKDPMTQFLIEQGVPWEPCVNKPEEVAVFSFYIESSDYTLDDLTAVHHCNIIKMFAEEWCDHNPSSTVIVRDNEWLEVGAWVYKNFDSILGTSFLPYFGSSTYQQLPIEPVSRAVWEEGVANSPSDLDWYRLAEIENGVDNVERTRELACVSGTCEIPN